MALIQSEQHELSDVVWEIVPELSPANLFEKFLLVRLLGRQPFPNGLLVWREIRVDGTFTGSLVSFFHLAESKVNHRCLVFWKEMLGMWPVELTFNCRGHCWPAWNWRHSQASVGFLQVLYCQPLLKKGLDSLQVLRWCNFIKQLCQSSVIISMFCRCWSGYSPLFMNEKRASWGWERREEKEEQKLNGDGYLYPMRTIGDCR